MSNGLDLTGRIALVTGGGTGIGLILARSFAKNGAKVYITGRRLEVLEKTAAEESSYGFVPLQMDITDKESVQKAITMIGEKDRKLDILVNNAGISGPTFPFIVDRSSPEHKTMGESLFTQFSFDQWTDVLKTNTIAPFFVTMGFLSLLQRGAESREGETSSVINISSGAGTTNLSLTSFAYGVSKAGINHLTSMMATEFALSKIPVRVNCIAPGLFPSQMGNPFADADNRVSQPMPGGLLPVPAGRIGKESEIGTAAVFLASSAGEYTNGIVMLIDGGHNLVNP